MLLAQNWILVDRWFIACIRLLLLQDQNDSLQQRENSQFAVKEFACPASRRTNDREEFIAKKENLLFRDYRWELSDSSRKLTDGTATKTSCVVNETITSISKNNRLLWK